MTEQSKNRNYDALTLAAKPRDSLLQASLKRIKLTSVGSILDEILPCLLYGSDGDRATAIATYERHEVEILEALESETHVALIESVEHRYQGFVLEHCIELIKEFTCTTPSEKMLCELAAGAMARHFFASRQLKDLRNERWSTSNRRTKSNGARYQQKEEEWTTVRDHLQRISQESKEVDRSLRQYQSIIAQLTHKKSPVPEVHIKTAFLAQNQQINVPKIL